MSTLKRYYIGDYNLSAATAHTSHTVIAKIIQKKTPSKIEYNDVTFALRQITKENINENIRCLLLHLLKKKKTLYYPPHCVSSPVA